MGHDRAEVEEAFARFLELGAQNRDWPAWAGAVHRRRPSTSSTTWASSRAGPRSSDWIVKEMSPFPSMTFSIDWSIIEGDRVAFYIWNHLPDPDGGDTLLQLPEPERHRVRRRREVEVRGGPLQPGGRQPGRRRLVPGRRRSRHPARPVTDRHLRLHAPSRPRTRTPGTRSRRPSSATANGAPPRSSSGDWDQWADQFTEDARYYEHHYGRFSGREEIRAWIKGVMQPFPDDGVPVRVADDRRQPGRRLRTEQAARPRRAATRATSSPPGSSSTTPVTTSGPTRRTATTPTRRRRSSNAGSRPAGSSPRDSTWKS